MSSVDCHIFVADDETAIDFDPTLDEMEDSYTTDTFISMTLAELWAIIEKRHYDSDLQEQFQVLIDEEDGSFIIERLPSKFVAALTQVKPDEISSLVESWSKTEENSSLPHEEVATMVNELIRLAKVAQKQDMHLYICNVV